MKAGARATRLVAADRTAGLGVLMLLLGCYLATMTGLPGNPDAEVEYQTTRSLAHLEGFAISTETPEGQGIVATRFDVREGTDGRFYSWFGVGQALAAVPLHWVGQLGSLLFPGLEERHAGTEAYGLPRSEYLPHLFVGLRNPLLGAATGWLLFLCLRAAGIRRRGAVVAALAYGLASFAWPQARDGLSDVQATFLVTLSLYALLRARASFEALRPPHALLYVGLGASLGAMVLTRVLTAPIAVVFALGVVWVALRGRQRLWSMPLLKGQAGASRAGVDVLWFAAPALVAAAFLLWSNQARFGDPLETGYSDAVQSGTFFSYPPLLGLLGVTVAPAKGLLWHAPFVVLALFGLRRLWRDRFLALLSLGVTLAVFLPPIHTQTFHGAWTYGPRYVLPALPVLWIAAAAGFEAIDRPRLRLLAVGAVALGAVTALGGVVVDQSAHHDLGLQAARAEWPEIEDESERAADDQRFVLLQWDWRFAAPWAHWRIFRHRAAGLPEEFDARQLYFLRAETEGAERPLVPTHERDTGFRHLAWVDLEQRLGGRAWPALALAGLLVAAGVAQLVRAFDPTQP